MRHRTATPNSTIPPVYTYWGQFVDHDVTANTDRNDVVSIVGDPLTPIEPDLVLGTSRLPGADLPRVAATGMARVGDSRKDENLIVAQLHLAFLRFHNAVVDWLVTTSPSCAATTPASPAPESSLGGTTSRSSWRTCCAPSR